MRNPDPATIKIEDLAYHLSLECRWGCATRRHYGVAEHSIWVARYCRKMVTEECRELMTIHALLHDAHEAYLKDLPTPIKCLFPAYKELCAVVDRGIYAALGLELPGEAAVRLIKHADQYATWVESKVLTVGPDAGVQPPPHLACVGMQDDVYLEVSPATAARAWLHAFELSSMKRA